MSQCTKRGQAYEESKPGSLRNLSKNVRKLSVLSAEVNFVL